MEDEPDEPTNSPGNQPESLLPYEAWQDQAMRHVLVLALKHAGSQGLPGEHHFYLSFRTDYPGVVIPDRLRAQYPQEMTIILQHQFWDLLVDEEAGQMSVGLSFSGQPSTLHIPLAAIVGFADPHVRFGLRFTPPVFEAPEPQAEPEPEVETEVSDTPQVVSLDAFRRRTPPKD
jgi:hypothetical protein